MPSGGQNKGKSKISSVSREQMLQLLITHNSQYKVAEALGCSQSCVGRRIKQLSITFDGRPEANKNESRREKQSDSMKDTWKSGAYSNVVRYIPPELRERISKSLKGRKVWNAGIKTKSKIVICEFCNKEFETNSARNRKFCSRECSNAHFKIIYSDGRLDGKKNPNFGNGEKLKIRHKEGIYSYRSPKQFTRGNGGYFGEIWMRSSWELLFAKQLSERGIEFIYEPTRLKLSNGQWYIPDFYIPNKNLYIEIKGWWTDKAKEKFSRVREEYPELKVVVIGEIWWKRRHLTI